MIASTPTNSTNVRSYNPALARAYFRLASRAFPEVAGRQVERLFTTPPVYRGREVAPPGARRRAVPFGPTDLATWEAGAPGAPAVLLVHGWGGRGVQLGNFVGPLRERGFRVVWFDQPGHGESGRGRVGLPVFVRAVQALARDRGPFHAAIGHSLGAAALGLALRRGLALTRAVFVSTPASMHEQARAFARMLGIAPWVRDAMRARLERRYGMPFAEIDRLDDLQRIALPSLFVHDRDDAEVPFENTLRLAGRMPQARVLRTHGLGHRRLLREQGVVEAIAGFVQGDDDVPAEWPPLPRPAPIY
jgi:pimeloyl-ACP methyl ester carboxylesterase